MLYNTKNIQNQVDFSIFADVYARGIFLIVVWLSMSVVSGQHTAASVYHEAYKKYNQKRYAEAIPLFEEALKQYPEEDRLAYSCLGYAYYSERKYDKAIQTYEYSLHSFPDINTGHCIRMLAFCYNDIGNYEKSLEYCELYQSLLEQLKKWHILSKENEENEQNILYIRKKNEQELKSLTVRNQLKNNPVQAKITCLSALNDATDDIAPCITPDESTIYFTSYRKRENASFNGQTEQWDGNIFISNRSANGLSWSNPVSIHQNINTTNQEGPCTLTSDGNTLYYYTWFEGTGGDIVESKSENGIWSKPKRLSDAINSNIWESQPTISADGNMLVFVRSEGYAQPSDLWYSTKDASGKWTVAKNMGSTVNTSMSEMSPYLHIDGKTLYFSSNGHATMGGYDIFKTVLQPDGTWSKPENVGYPINSEKDDQYFVLNASGTKGYFSSNRENPKNKMNLYQADLPEEFRTQHVTLLTGYIKDEINDIPLVCKIQIEDLTTHTVVQTISSNSNGKFSIVLAQNKKYGVRIEKKNYESKYAVFEVNKNFQSVKKIIKLRSIEKQGGTDLRRKDELSGF